MQSEVITVLDMQCILGIIMEYTFLLLFLPISLMSVGSVVGLDVGLLVLAGLTGLVTVGTAVELEEDIVAVLGRILDTVRDNGRELD